MKNKIKYLIIGLIICSLLMLSPLVVNAAKKGDKITKNVTVTSDIIEEELWDGIDLERMAIQTERLGTVSTTEGLVYNWDYNAVTAANTPAIKIASWGLSTKTGYKQGTTAQIAKNYESTHPGYMVIAAINGDFFANTQYTSSNGYKNNPTYDPINTWVADGGITLKKPTVAHPHHNVIGFNLDRTYTYHIGSIYDANGDPTPWNLGANSYYTDTNGNQITTISLPNAGENLPVFTDTMIFTIGDYKTEAYIKNSNFSETGVNIILNGSNINTEGFKVVKIYMDRYSRPNDGFQGKYWYGESMTNHAYDLDYTGLYIAGRTFDPEDLDVIESIGDNYCYLLTKDEEVLSRVVKNTSITCQYELTGDVWGNCNSTIGTVLPYILKGVRTQYVAKADNYLNDAKPKAIVAFTENNECIFMLVGPGELSGSTTSIQGPSSIEVAELLERVGAYDAFALDGGGSATIVVRDANGNFQTLNKTTDGTDRSIGNALLMIVEKPNLTLQEKTSTKATFYQSAPMAESTLIEATVHINGKSYALVDGSVTVEGLNKNTSYDYYFTYKFENAQGVHEMKTNKASFTTLKQDEGKPSNIELNIMKNLDGSYSINLSYTANDTEFVSAEILDRQYTITTIEQLEVVLNELDIESVDKENLGVKIHYLANGEEREITFTFADINYVFEVQQVDNPNPPSGGNGGGGGFSCNMGMLAAGLLALTSLAFVIIRKKH